LEKRESGKLRCIKKKETEMRQTEATRRRVYTMRTQDELKKNPPKLEKKRRRNQKS